MDERLRFVARLLEGELMSHLCREVGISRKTGDKILDRCQETGLEGLRQLRGASVAGDITALQASMLELRRKA